MKMKSRTVEIKSKPHLILGLLYIITMSIFYGFYIANFISNEKYNNFSDIDVIILFLPYIATVIDLKISELNVFIENYGNLKVKQLSLDIAVVTILLAFMIVFLSMATKKFLPIVFSVTLLTAFNIFAMLIKSFHYIFKID